MWYLVGVSDGRKYPIPPQGLTIGREGCTVIIPADDGRASRRHAVVRPRGNEVEVDDCGSTNGTYLDNDRLSGPMSFRPGAMLRCGNTQYYLIADAGVSNKTVMASPMAPTTAAPLWGSVAPAAVQLQPAPPRGYAQPAAPAFRPPTTNSRPGIPLITVGAVLLVLGLIGWQHYQPAINNINSFWGQLAVGFDGEAAQQAAQMKLMYTVSIATAFIGGILLLGGILQLALAKR